jgi:pentapeptide MXKDX repeat protein
MRRISQVIAVVVVGLSLALAATGCKDATAKNKTNMEADKMGNMDGDKMKDEKMKGDKMGDKMEGDNMETGKMKGDKMKDDKTKKDKM